MVFLAPKVVLSLLQAGSSSFAFSNAPLLRSHSRVQAKDFSRPPSLEPDTLHLEG